MICCKESERQKGESKKKAMQISRLEFRKKENALDPFSSSGN
jgi:hypothetical protein